MRKWTQPFRWALSSITMTGPIWEEVAPARMKPSVSRGRRGGRGGGGRPRRLRSDCGRQTAGPRGERGQHRRPDRSPEVPPAVTAASCSPGWRTSITSRSASSAWNGAVACYEATLTELHADLRINTRGGQARRQPSHLGHASRAARLRSPVCSHDGERPTSRSLRRAGGHGVDLPARRDRAAL